MTTSAQYTPSRPGSRSRRKADGRPALELTRAEFLWPVLFMLCMSMTGGGLYPMFLFVLIIMLKRFRENIYDFAIMTFLLAGGYALMSYGIFPVKMADVALLSALALAVLLRKPPIMKKTLLWYILYMAVLVWIATQSWESMKVQMLSLRFYGAFIAVFIPLAIFANKAFDLRVFVRRFMVYIVTASIFVLIDAFILKQHYLMTEASWSGAHFYWQMRPNIFSLGHERVYPHGLFYATIGLVPALRLFRIPAWIWIVIGLAVLATTTFSFIFAMVVVLVLFQGNVKRILQICGAAVIGFGLLYLADIMLPGSENEYGVRTSALRISSTIEQFTALYEAADDEDLASFGSGRMAQAIPKVELVEFYHKEWTGLGFLHKDYSKGNRFQLHNEYYSDVTQSDEVATGVEIVPVQLYISGGWTALIAVNLFYFGLWFFIRRLEYSYLYLSTWIFVMVMGIGGFASPTTYPGVQLLSLSYALVILANRAVLPGFSPADTPRPKPSAN